MDMAIGTPSLSFPAVLDTGSDLIWTQCKPCEHCFNQSTSIFDPSTSSTYKMLPCTADLCKALPSFKCGVSNSSCQYRYAYTDRTSSAGKLSSETFTLGSTKFDNIAFGCGNNNTDGQHEVSGVAGLGRGSLSLISQLGFKKFSYCFVSLDKEKKSPMHHLMNYQNLFCTLTERISTFRMVLILFFIQIRTGLLCLTVMPSSGVVSILGNYLQYFFIICDIGENKLSFTPTQCDKL
ncbi:aspartic proteinase nepenthesin-2-like protein [Carex littledalei]|uniref:Aspartic proteinase nepenthesin-2-like protein n=1 Tax=Carex littledalei TaxID=544730 RepID=A0A833VR88_9POAL|nr:aspartic proteinase nepenthesin-2-like protein [Carex littledalei]